MGETSIVEYFSAHERYKCGYCKSEDSCYSFGLWGHSLTPLDYQNLIDRGWRRSGKYCYKPTMHLTCCPQYTIRCEALKFALSRSQKKVLKKVHKFLAYGERERNTSQSLGNIEQTMDISDIPETMDVQILKNIKKVAKISRSDIETLNPGSLSSASCSLPHSQQVNNNTLATSVQGLKRKAPDSAIQTSKKRKRSANHTTTNASLNQDKDILPLSPSTKPSVSESSHANVSVHPISPSKSVSEKPCKKAKELRRERKLQKLLNKGIPVDEALSSVQKKPSEPKTVENFLTDPFPEKPAYKLELRLVPSDSDEFRSTHDESYNLYKKYQMKIHNDSEDACDRDAFQDFLIETPFEHTDGVPSSETSNYGSFHHQYWLNGKLIAVGVIDILSYCVSSVYFYYDPDYSFLSLGTYAALREIALTRELNKKYPNIQYYYMGYYIHSCIKMKYKGQYHPSYLLCPETYIFQPIEKCKPKLDKAKYHRLEEDSTKEDRDGIVNLQEILILYNHKRMTYQVYRKEKKQANDEQEVREYAGFVGRKCYRRMLLYRN